MNKLTIGMPVFDDFDGVYFTIQALRMYHDIDFDLIVIDNNPRSSHGMKTRDFVNTWTNAKYIEFTEKIGTSIKNQVFLNSETEYTMCIDCHVMIKSGGLKSLIRYFEKNPDTKDLIQGPLWMDNLNDYCTHFNDKWGGMMHGQWDTDKKGHDSGMPFEIQSMGMGLFACRTDAWPGFHSLFMGFGGEEGYMHRKFLNRGDKCICIPDLKWVHRFERPNGVPYPNIVEDRFWNYIIGALDTGFNIYDGFVQEACKEFGKVLPQSTINNILISAENTYYKE